MPAGKWGAVYLCWDCKYKWTGFAGPDQGFGVLECPQCGGAYMSWLNRKEMFNKVDIRTTKKVNNKNGKRNK